MTRTLMVLCSSWRYKNSVNNVPGWTVYKNTPSPVPERTSDPFGKRYTRVISEVKPDFVLGICCGCTEQLWDDMEKPEGPKYISWSTDSYRHTKRPETSDLHLTSIPDETYDPKKDNFLPLFAEHDEAPLPMSKRMCVAGIHCRPYDVAGGWRVKELERLKGVFGPKLFVNHKRVPPHEFIAELRSFRFSLNVPVYPDGLPNFRSFEAGACGVMPLIHERFRPVMDDIGCDGLVEYYDDSWDAARFDELKSATYDVVDLQKRYNDEHSLRARMTELFDTFFDIEF